MAQRTPEPVQFLTSTFLPSLAADDSSRLYSPVPSADLADIVSETTSGPHRRLKANGTGKLRFLLAFFVRGSWCVHFAVTLSLDSFHPVSRF
jgi:hypothetical protein